MHREPSEEAVYLLDGDRPERLAIARQLESRGLAVRSYGSAKDFLAEVRPNARGCAVVDIDLPDANGISLTRELKERGYTMPVLVIDGRNAVRTAVSAIHAGAADFIERPFAAGDLLGMVAACLQQDRARTEDAERIAVLRQRIATLTPRERQVMDLVLAGETSKQIARILDLSPRTVETYRASILQRTGASGVAELAQMALLAQPAAETRLRWETGHEPEAPGGADNVLELDRFRREPGV